jgi:chromosome partitioning protein
MSQTNDFVIIDCPGSDTFLARLGHGVADTLVTPMNDSFVDVDLLARVDPETYEVRSPSWYSEMIWEARKRRYLTDRHAIDWVVLRNRLSHTEARNKRHVNAVLTTLAPRIGFRHIPGLGERVIFRELFLRGLTLSDLKVANNGVQMTMTHVAAHQEIKSMVAALRLPLADGHKRAPLQRGTAEPAWATSTPTSQAMH